MYKLKIGKYYLIHNKDNYGIWCYCLFIFDGIQWPFNALNARFIDAYNKSSIFFNIKINNNTKSIIFDTTQVKYITELYKYHDKILNIDSLDVIDDLLTVDFKQFELSIKKNQSQTYRQYMIEYMESLNKDIRFNNEQIIDNTKYIELLELLQKLLKKYNNKKKLNLYNRMNIIDDYEKIKNIKDMMQIDFIKKCILDTVDIFELNEFTEFDD